MWLVSSVWNWLESCCKCGDKDEVNSNETIRDDNEVVIEVNSTISSRSDVSITIEGDESPKDDGSWPPSSEETTHFHNTVSGNVPQNPTTRIINPSDYPFPQTYAQIVRSGKPRPDPLITLKGDVKHALYPQVYNSNTRNVENNFAGVNTSSTASQEKKDKSKIVQKHKNFEQSETKLRINQRHRTTKHQRRGNQNRSENVAFFIQNQFKKGSLLIAVDATSKTVGGYLLNPIEQKVQYYHAKIEELPWTLRNQTPAGNSAEFELKNMLCALLIWEMEIIKYGKVVAAHYTLLLYTDNSAIKSQTLYSQRVHSLLNHLTSCVGVSLLNPRNMFVNRHWQPVLFEMVITPADALSRNKEDAFLSHIRSAFWKRGIEERQSIEKKEQNSRRWVNNPCKLCGFHLHVSQSLKKKILISE